LKNFKPNAIAKNLKTKKSFTIGVIIPNILNPFFAKVFSGIERFANSKGYNLITCVTNESFNKERQMLDMLDTGSIDGFILALSEETQKLNSYQHIKNTINNGTPVVLFDRITADLNCDKVIVDDYESAVNASQYLIDSGSKNFALLSSINNLSVGKLRAKGFEDTLLKNKKESVCVVLTDNQDDFDKEVNKIFENKIDAVFALDEHASVSVMKKAILEGYKIPEDIQIIGFADGLWSKRMTPSLSTVSQHAPEIGEKAAELLIKRIESPTGKEEAKNYKTEIVKTELRKRDSVKKL
jgi:LacI family transcriptional regulator